MSRALPSASAALLSLALASCNTTASTRLPPQRGTPVSLTSAQTSAVHAGVRANLKDPESARFESLTAVKDAAGDTIVCGMVNAKNSYGGYTGKQQFFGVFGPQGYFSVAGGGEAEAASSCANVGIYL